ncbi:gluconate 2-dehydrogenase subunit 3 family protein [Pedobacter sp. B4-66]|uniref:gluconate 2-dehydrogenase subunit 3 family protein n=1 Tax=Pedobacter sp. B4-66 TaxID=2817280 RepID=UPI001BD9C3D3|nr:gluconate 2-dehydrogenase subunit 3 family protein [Pedobacter sp. B4-66]
MNRRKVLKIGGIAGFSGLFSFSIYKAIFELDHPYKEYFSEHKILLAEVVDCIIPETQSAGAKAAGVHIFIIGILENCASEVEKSNFYKGLEELKRYSINEYGSSFMNCNEKQRDEIITYFENKGEIKAGIVGKIRKKVLGEPFFSLLKRYTIDGYCNSYLGASRNLKYDKIPHTYEPCISYRQGEPSWATK